MAKKIAVLGTGANGSCISADLIKAGLDVTMIDQWPEHVETIRRVGLHISLPDEELHVEADANHLCDLASMNRTFDIVIICLKAYDTRWGAELIKPYIADDAIVVGVQNCMTHDDIAEIVGHNRTIGCAVVLASEMFEPGKVKRSITREKTLFGLGALDASMTERNTDVEEVLKHSGRVTVEENIRSGKWMKLIVNAMSMGAPAMVGLNVSEAVKLPGMHDIILKCGQEALTAGQSKGYTVEPVLGITREDLESSNQMLDLILERIYSNVGTTFTSTVAQDLIKGRYSEVDLINGAAIEENEKHGIDSPASKVIIEITRRIHAGELEIGPANLDLAKEMLGM